MPDKNYIEKICTSLATILPQATEHALRSYHEFASQELSHNAKDFNTHHTACKAALVHVDYLIKLVQWLINQMPDPSDSDDSLLKLVHEARLQLLKAQQNYE